MLRYSFFGKRACAYNLLLKVKGGRLGLCLEPGNVQRPCCLLVAYPHSYRCHSFGNFLLLLGQFLLFILHVQSALCGVGVGGGG